MNNQVSKVRILINNNNKILYVNYKNWKNKYRYYKMKI